MTKYPYSPHERPSLSEIKAHPWFNGTLPTHGEIKKEFDQRKITLAAENNKEDDPMPDSAIDPSVFQANIVYKSVGDGNVEEVKASGVERKVVDYIPELKRYTEFYSTSSADDLFKIIATFGKDFAQECSFDDEEYKASLKVKSGENVVELSVSILKVDEGKHCVEVMKEKGTKFEFHKVYHQLKSLV